MAQPSRSASGSSASATARADRPVAEGGRAGKRRMPGKRSGRGKAGADFARRVHAFVRKVPAGRVTTYGDVAWAVGAPGGARAVGRVMRDTPEGSTTPCHRVVRAGGHVVPVRGNALVARLKAEGVAVKAGVVQGFAKRRWP